jgi:hypothetical protein
LRLESLFASTFERERAETRFTCTGEPCLFARVLREYGVIRETPYRYYLFKTNSKDSDPIAAIR